MHILLEHDNVVIERD